MDLMKSYECQTNADRESREQKKENAARITIDHVKWKFSFSPKGETKREIERDEGRHSNVSYFAEKAER